jgi:hypothetical protein
MDIHEISGQQCDIIPKKIKKISAGVRKFHGFLVFNI